MAKQGGKGKTSSPSRQASHKRGPARTEANRTRKIARQARRMGVSVADLARMGATLSDPFNGAPKTRRPGGEPDRRIPLPMRDTREIPRNTPAGFVIVDGRILEASPWASDLHDAFNRAHAFPRAIIRRSPLGVLVPSEVKTR